MFGDLIPQFSDHFHVIASDCVGFGYSDAPAATGYEYTFNNSRALIDELLFTNLKPTRISMYVQDYGAPIDFRIAAQHRDLHATLSALSHGFGFLTRVQFPSTG